MPTGDSLYPVLKGVSPLPALPSLAAVRTQTINPYLWGPRKPTMDRWFDSTNRPRRVAPSSTESTPRGAAAKRPRLGVQLASAGAAAARLPGLRHLRTGLLPLLAGRHLVDPRSVRLLSRARGLAAALRPGQPWFTFSLSRRLLRCGGRAPATRYWVGAAAASRALARLSDRVGGEPHDACGVVGSSPARCGSCCSCRPGCPRSDGYGSSSPTGCCDPVGLHRPFVTHTIIGPFGVLVAGALRALHVPRDQRRASRSRPGVRGRRTGPRRRSLPRDPVVTPILAPAISSALAEASPRSVSDFGVASTLAYRSHFTLATYRCTRRSTGSRRAFSTAAAVGWLLVASVAVPLVLQARALRGRSYPVLSGRTRLVVRADSPGATGWRSVLRFYVVALAVPGFGAVSGSLLADWATVSSPWSTIGASPQRRLDRTDRTVAHIRRDHRLGHGRRRLLVAQRSADARRPRLLDFCCSRPCASVVFAAGYIFAYNLPLLSKLGINIYQTTTLLILGHYAASTNARVLVGAVSQVQASLHDAARAHGAGALRAAGCFHCLAPAHDGVAVDVLRDISRAANLAPALCASRRRRSRSRTISATTTSESAWPKRWSRCSLLFSPWRSCSAATACSLRVDGDESEADNVAERILIEHVGKVYSGGNRALDDVDLEVDPGTFLVLLGPSGSGKTHTAAVARRHRAHHIWPDNPW